MDRQTILATVAKYRVDILTFAETQATNMMTGEKHDAVFQNITKNTGFL